MSIEDASALLWQQDAIPTTGFSIFKRCILQELSIRHGLVVGRTGKNARSIKKDYITALSNFVSRRVILRVAKH